MERRPGRLLQFRNIRPILRLGSFTPRREPPPYCALYSGQNALDRLQTLSELQAETLLSLCAASLSLYPAWERQSWIMPEPEAALQVHGGHFLDLADLSLRLGGVRHLAGRHSYLHAPSGLAFAAHQDAQGQVTLVLGGTNSSHTDSQPRTFPAEVQQLRADLLNVVGGVPRLYRAADLLTLLLRDELARREEYGPLTLAGHSLGGGMAQYAGLMNDVPVFAFSPTALGRGMLSLLHDAGRLGDPAAVTRLVHAYSLEGDPIPGLGTGWLQSSVVGEHLRLPLSPDVASSHRASSHATSHGQIYPHLVAWLRRRWPDLPDAIEKAREKNAEVREHPSLEPGEEQPEP
jgi:hypothetical protein